MATIEERLTALEQENTALKKSDELQTIALRALATKDALEGLRDTNNKIFDVLTSHNQLTNERLGDIQTQVIELDGKVVGLQVEMHQSFKRVEARLETMATKDDLSAMNARFDTVDARFDQIMLLLTALAPKPEQGT